MPHFARIQKISQESFGTHWHGQSSDWDQLRGIVKYLSALHELITNNELPDALVTYLASNPNLKTLKELLTTVEDHQSNYPNHLQTVVDKIQLDEKVRFGNDNGLKQLAFSEQEKSLNVGELNQTVSRIWLRITT